MLIRGLCTQVGLAQHYAMAAARTGDWAAGLLGEGLVRAPACTALPAGLQAADHDMFMELQTLELSHTLLQTLCELG
jgi:hypothetical protein